MQINFYLRIARSLILPTLMLIGLSGCNEDEEQHFSVELRAGYALPKLQHDLKGNAELTLNLSNRTLSGSINLDDFEATSAHVHEGYLGENGPVILTFDNDPNDPTRLLLTDSQLDEAQLETLLEGGTYINIHTENYPNGALRAQILSEEFSLKAFNILPSQSIPTVYSDATGTGYITIDEVDNNLVINAHSYGEMIPTAVHLHEASIGNTGEVITSLMNSEQNPNHWSAKLSALTDSQIEAAKNNELYIDFHSERHPAGELRGQLASIDQEIINFDLSSLQEIPAFHSSMRGTAVALLSHNTNNVTLVVDSENINSPTAAHIHTGNIGENGSALYSLIADSALPNRFKLNEQLLNDDFEHLKSGRLYVNVHSDDRLEGAIRGQVISTPTETGFLLDPTMLVDDSKLFHVTYSGQFLGTASVEISVVDGVATFTEITDVPAFGVDETLIGTIDSLTGSPISYSGIGISGSRNIEIAFDWSATHVTGSTDEQEEPVNIALPHNALETLSLFYMAHAMPLAEGIQIELPVFSALDATLFQRTLTVEAIEEVTVAAGTFETYKVLIGGHPTVNQYLYITTESPRKLVQIGFDAFPTMFYELQP